MVSISSRARRTAVLNGQISLSGKLGLLSFLIFTMVTAGANRAFAGFVVISNFTSSSISADTTHGWTWDPIAKGVVIYNDPQNLDATLGYLREGSIPNIDVTGATTLSLSAEWDPLATGDGGTFKISLEPSNGVDFASATFSFAEFAGGGVKTVVKPLTWISSPNPARVVQWDLEALTFTGTGGDLYFQQMGTSDQASVPEPSSLIIFGMGAAGVVWRARRRSKLVATLACT